MEEKAFLRDLLDHHRTDPEISIAFGWFWMSSEFDALIFLNIMENKDGIFFVKNTQEVWKKDTFYRDFLWILPGCNFKGGMR